MPHDIHRNYNNPELYEWMLSQSKTGTIETPKIAEKQDTDTIIQQEKPRKSKPFRLFKRKKQKTEKPEETNEDSEKMKIKFE
jgi:hypothetical protein